MPTTIKFDTYAYVKKLKSAGFTDEQAEIQAEALKGILGTELATKKYLTEARLEIIKWVAVMLIAQAGFVAALVKLL